MIQYTQSVYPAFEDLKQAAAQLAGLLVLKQRDPQLRRCAEEAYHRAMDTLTMHVPVQAKARHTRLLQAATHIHEALQTNHDPLPYLKAADAELRAAGFQMVDFTHACCHQTHA
jgi:hypothetical protein